MFNICKPNTAWWDSVRNDNLKLFSQQIENYVGKPDQRPTDLENNIIQGFTALHYACYLNRPEFVEKLVLVEFQCTTTENVKIQAMGVSENAKIQLPSRSNCLQIALLAGATKCIEIITAHIAKKMPPEFPQDDFGRNILTVAGMTLNEVEPLKIDWFNEQLSAEEGEEQFIETCCYFGRFEQLKELVEFFVKNQENKKLIYLMVIEVDDEGKNCLQLCDKEFECEKCGASQEGKRMCKKYVTELVTDALKYLGSKHCDEAIEKFRESFGTDVPEFFGEEEFEGEEED